MKTADYKSFTYLENGDVNFSEFGIEKSSNILDPGSYKLDYLEYPHDKVSLRQDTDFEVPKVFNFPHKKKIDNLFDSFFNTQIKEKIEGMGFCHKVGILLHGDGGTGKTSIIKYYCDSAIKNQDAIVFHILCNNDRISQCWDFIQNIRRIQENPIIIVFDEFDDQMNENEAILKTIIDGNMSISQCIFFAATNYIDKIPSAMSERPSRFKYCLHIKGINDEQDIIDVLNPILGDMLTTTEINDIAKDLKGNTLDYIKQYCFDILMNIKHYNVDKPKIGFNTKKNDKS